MLRAVHTAATGMEAMQTNVDNVANNLANVNTTSYKKSVAEFQDLYYQTVRAPGSQVSADTNLPTGVQVDVRGQISIHKELFSGLNIGLMFSVLTVFLLLLGYFQSLRLALITILGIPFVLCGAMLALKLTATTWNLQSFMGTIMAVGVSSANAILLVSFARKAMEDGAANGLEAARTASTQRFRAILMTALAMIAGMIPMALGKTSAGEQAASLARPVIEIGRAHV